jgi:AAA+ superfamily predicted ATPase
MTGLVYNYIIYLKTFNYILIIYAEGKVKPKKIKFKSGEVYIGEIFKKTANGNGKYYDKYGKLIYDGHWIHGLPNGIGTYINKDDDTYTGTFQNGMFHGFGKVVDSLGVTIEERVFEYELVEADLKTAYQKQITKETTPTDEKHLKEKVSKGWFKSKSKQFLSQNLGETFYGTSKKMEGIVVYRVNYSDGSCFISYGSMKDAQRNGFCVLSLSSGDVYVGENKDSFLHGHGTYYFNNGDVHEGEFREKNYHGKGIHFNFEESMTYEGNWKNDKKDGPFQVTTKQGTKSKRFYHKNEVVKPFLNNDFHNNKNNKNNKNDRYSPVQTKKKDKSQDKVSIINTVTNPNPAQSQEQNTKWQTLDELIDEKFKDFVGMEDAKYELKKIISLKRLKGDNYSISDMHMAFTGGSGTGKTSVARIFADVLYEGGILPTNKLVEVNYANLYGAYVGHSLRELNDKIEEAQNGILFFDETHQLNLKNNSSDFNRELVNGLITTLENKRDSFIVIFAGYGAEMEDWIKTTDKGLSSRISRIINFGEFEPKELLSILKGMLAKEKNKNNKSFSLAENVDEIILKLIIAMKARKGDNFGNAREMRVLVRKILENFATFDDAANRTVITREDLAKIFKKNDIDKTTSDSNKDTSTFFEL